MGLTTSFRPIAECIRILKKKYKNILCFIWMCTDSCNFNSDWPLKHWPNAAGLAYLAGAGGGGS